MNSKYIRIENTDYDRYTLSDKKIEMLWEYISSEPRRVVSDPDDRIWCLDHPWACDSRDRRQFKSLNKLWKYSIIIELKIFQVTDKTWDWKSVELNFDTRTQLLKKLSPYKGTRVQYAHLKRWWKP